MPYRRLPKTDAARLRALKALLENDDIYTVRNRFIDWDTLNRAQPAYEKLMTACQQYKICLQVESRNVAKTDKLRRNATMYLSHFLRVLIMTVERGEIKRKNLLLYGLPEDTSALPPLRSDAALIELGQQVVEGEKARLAKRGRPIYNPSIGMVSTHLDIFKEIYEQRKALTLRTSRASKELDKLRADVDAVILELWNQIEKHFETEPPEKRFDACRKFGVIYYYRRHEEHLY